MSRNHDNFADLITFTRASQSTVVDSDGLLKYPAHNLVENSEDLTQWTLSNLTAAGNDIAAPDGTTTADKLTDSSDGSSVIHRARESISVAANTKHRLAIFAKKGTTAFFQLALIQTSNSKTASVVFDLENGVVGEELTTAGGNGTVHDSSITDVGNGWFLCQMTAEINSDANQYQITLATQATGNSDTLLQVSYNGDGTRNAYFWGAHLYKADKQMQNNPAQSDANFATYVPTTSASVFQPRIDFDPVTKDRKGFLIEEARTNLLTYSEDFTQYSNARTVDTANQGTAPDGSNNATKLSETADTNNHNIQLDINFSYTSGDTYTHSAFLKAGTVSVMQLLLPSSAFGSNAFANYDLTNGVVGTVGSSATASIEDFGNGWFRCVLTAAVTSTSTADGGFIVFTNNSTTAARAPSYAGDTASHVFIFGNQLEEGAFPTSYIPTSGASATRAADAASIATSAFGYNQDEGTIVAEAQTFKADLFHRVASLNNGTSVNRMILQANATTHLFVEVDDVGQTSRDAGAYTSNVFTKHAAAFQKNNFGACLDGGSVSAGTSGTLPVVNIINIGAAVTGSFGFLNGHIKKLQYFPRRLSDTQLQEITR